MSVTVYSTPSCSQCNMTKMELKRKGVAFDEVNLVEDDKAMAFVRSLGYSSAPVVVVGEKHWSGFRPDLIKGL